MSAGRLARTMSQVTRRLCKTQRLEHCRILPGTKLDVEAPEPSDGHVSTGQLLRWLKTRLLSALGRLDIGAPDGSHPPRRLEEPWFSMAFYDIFVMGDSAVKLGARGRSYVVVLVRAC